MIHLCDETYLTADKYQFILFELHTVEKGERKGEKDPCNQKFIPTLPQVIHHLLHGELYDELADDDIESLEDFGTKFNTLLEKMNKVIDNIGNTEFRKLVAQSGDDI
jgi:hypothetical protein